MLDSERQTIEVVKKISPSVVSITVSKMMPRPAMISSQFNPLDSIEPPIPVLPGVMPGTLEDIKEKVKVGGGSGFIVGPSGLILTNKHVVFDADAEYSVTTIGGQEHIGKVISRDPINDVALLKIEAADLPSVTLGDSNAIQLGQTVIAIGNALGLFSNTVSKGIVSGLGRKISASLGQTGQMENLHDVIQTDVAINQGNSGGPLIDLDGNVIGINTAIIYGAQNIGFALPINWVKSDLKDFATYGRIVRPYLGLRYIMLNKEIAQKYMFAVDYGALVSRDHVPGSKAVIPDSPADKAGIKENDVILSINDERLDAEKELADVIRDKKVGDELKITIMRDGQTLDLKTVLRESK